LLSKKPSRIFKTEEERKHWLHTTTLGNISSWVAHDLQSSGPEISHSITCSTALHAVLNGCMVEIRMIDKFMVGGSET
jgi:3-oxoacyl-(acyl-carrier-protein) synthase